MIGARRIVLAIALALVAMPVAARAGDDRYSAMTYNIRLDLASDGADAWPHRRDAVVAILRYHAPDIVGMQEVLLHQKQALEADLPDYAFVGVARDDGRAAGEFSPLGYRRDRFVALGSGTFWLSPTPGVPGKGWDAAYPRIATWARLRDRRTRATILALNTHFDHVGEEARRESAALIRRWVATHRRRGDGVIVLGDFNSPTSSAAHAAITAGPAAEALRDARRVTCTEPFGPPGTFTGFDIARADAAPIDHVFVSANIAVLRHATLTYHRGGRLPSDHYPVIAHLRLGKRC